MKIFLFVCYLILSYLLALAYTKAGDKFAKFSECSETVHAKHRGFVRDTKSRSRYWMKVRYEYEGKEIETLLIDERPLSFFGAHASNGDLEVFVNPKKPGQACIFRKRQMIKGYVLTFLIIAAMIALTLHFAGLLIG